MARQDQIRLLHIVDAGLTWDERLGLEQLLDRLPPERFTQHVICLGPVDGEVRRLAGPPDSIAVRLGLSLTAAPALRSWVVGHEIDLVHGWGPRAAAAVCGTQLAKAVKAVSLFDPSRAPVYARLVRAADSGGNTAALCATEIVRRRIVERGVAPEQAVMVRPGVNFAGISQAKKSDLRERLGMPADGLMLLTDSPATREGGQFCAFWAGAVRSFLEPGVRVVVPGRSRETDRLRRLAHSLGMDALLMTPGDAFRQEDLIAVADGLLVAAEGECSVTAVAWAMGSGVPVIAAANRATAELLAHEHNAFLIKPDVTKRMALRFAEAVGRRNGWAKLKETARGQAFEVFSLRRYAEQVAQVYENLLAGRAATEGSRDPALV